MKRMFWFDVNVKLITVLSPPPVCSFGEQMQLLHPFQQQFNDESGARILRLCQFQQKKTRIAQVGISPAALRIAHSLVFLLLEQSLCWRSAALTSGTAA